MHLIVTMNEITCHCEQYLDTVYSDLFESNCTQVKTLMLREAHDGWQDELHELHLLFAVIGPCFQFVLMQIRK